VPYQERTHGNSPQARDNHSIIANAVRKYFSIVRTNKIIMDITKERCPAESRTWAPPQLDDDAVRRKVSLMEDELARMSVHFMAFLLRGPLALEACSKISRRATFTEKGGLIAMHSCAAVAASGHR
jgi:hypothetical protein